MFYERKFRMRYDKKTACTFSLIVINVIVFFILSFGGMTEDASYMLERGAMYTPFFILYEEYYRIFTSMLWGL